MSTQRNRRRRNPAIVGAVIAAAATVAAAVIPVTVELVRGRLAGDAPPVASASPSGPAASPPASAEPPTVGVTGPGTPSPTVGAAPPSGGPSSPAPGEAPPEAGQQSLTELPEVDDFEGWQQEPQVVAGRRYDTVLSASPCWLNDNFTATFVTSRGYSTLEARVGVADDSVPAPLRFAVLVDGKSVFTTSVGLGRTRAVKVDVSEATQVGLRISTTSTDQCHDNNVGVWIDPRLRR
ncbi:NPCBM/NEW2 domain-containing protein [Micromonospora fluostatini]|uniref:NPCBM/NEW2 domain-containing protein n=1 Tax=Micromonospora sp. JCM 30529 TaxID=3421643 RepID=UPI003D165D7D